MQVIYTIIPIFAVVILGWLSRKRGFMPQEFLGPANRIIYYLAIPALIFRSVSKASFRTDFNPTVLFIILGAVFAAYCAAGLIARLLRWDRSRIGSFIQCAGHGNLGYIGLPIAYYYLGESGLAKAGILAGFVMILQNMLSVMALQIHTAGDARQGIRLRVVAENLIRNSVIVSALLGVLVSLLQLPLPQVIDRFLGVMGGLAPPMSLMLIGASISVNAMQRNLTPVLWALLIKCIALPLCGLALFVIFGLDASNYLPGLILLASPTATVTYVMSKEMRGDAELAGAVISASTIFSALTYLVLLSVVGGG